MNYFTCPYSVAGDFVLPVPGVMVRLSPPFAPPILKGIKVYPDNPFRFDFILEKGDSNLSDEQIKDGANTLIKYFLASLTIPQKDVWVNLSPYEKDRIIPNSFGLTEMGRDLLAEDYMLKQITASLIYPEDRIGKEFWKRVYEEARNRFKTTNIPVNTFNKVWVVPEKAVVYENAQSKAAYIVESKLKVMLEQDYLALEKHNVISAREGSPNKNAINALGSQIVREIVIPELTKEVNEDRNFEQLRQVYNSLILADWYKKKIKENILSQVFTDENKISGVKNNDPQEKQKIYARYLQSFKKGVYNYIKEEQDPITQQPIARKYFSGGVRFDAAMLIFTGKFPQLAGRDHAFEIKVRLSPDAAMASSSALLYKGRNTKPREYNKHTDVVFTKTNLINLLVNGEGLWDSLKEELDYTQDKEIYIHGEKFGFFITVKGASETFYTLPVKDFERLLLVTGNALKEQLPLIQTSDFVLSRQGFENLFVDGRFVWYQFLSELGFTKYDQAPVKRIIVKGRAFEIVRKRSLNYGVGITLKASDFQELVRLKEWHFKSDSREDEQPRYAYRNIYRGFEFASKLERDTYIVLKHLGIIDELKPGINFQVEVPQQYGPIITIDFVTGGMIFEPHWEPDQVKQGNYYKKRREQINSTRFKDLPMGTFCDIRRKNGLYDILKLSIDRRIELEKLRKEANKDTIWLDGAQNRSDGAMLADIPKDGDIETGGQFIGYFLTEQQKVVVLDQLRTGQFQEVGHGDRVRLLSLGEQTQKQEKESQSALSASTFKNQANPGENFIYVQPDTDSKTTDIYFSSHALWMDFDKLNLDLKEGLIELIINFDSCINDYIVQDASPAVALRLADLTLRKQNSRVMRRLFQLLKLQKGFGDQFIEDIVREFKNIQKVRARIPPALVAFGSARVGSEAAMRHGFMFAQHGYAGISGGNDVGVMNDFNKGVFRGKIDPDKIQSVGSPIYIAGFEEKHSPYLDVSLEFTRFPTRVDAYTRLNAFGINSYIGGLGTLHELFDSLRRKEMHEIDKDTPVNLIGKSFYRSLIAAVKDLDDRGLTKYRAETLVQSFSDDKKDDERILETFESFMASRKSKGFKSIFEQGYEDVDLDGMIEEFRMVREKLGGLGPTITIVGQEQKSGLHPEYPQMAKQLGCEAALAGYSVIVNLKENSLGVYVQEGFRQAREEIINRGQEFLPQLVDISHGSAKEEGPNEIYLRIKHEPVASVVALGYGDQGTVYFPGGVETLSLWFNHLDLVQVGKIRSTRQILVGHEFWGRWMNILEEYVYKWKTVSAWALDLSTGVDSVPETISVLEGQRDKQWLYDWDHFNSFEDLGHFMIQQYIRLLETRQIPLFEGTVKLIKEVHQQNKESGAKLKIGVGSSNHFARIMLENDDLSPYFDVIVDGRTMVQKHIPPKPSPDFFKAVASELDINPAYSVVFEDGASGIESAVNGGFGLVIGVDRGGNRENLIKAGAHLVVNDISEINLDRIKSELAKRVGSQELLQGLIFDNDGVIVNTEPLYFEFIKELTNDYFAFLHQHFGLKIPTELTWQDYIKELSGKPVEVAIKEYFLNHGKGVPRDEAMQSDASTFGLGHDDIDDLLDKLSLASGEILDPRFSLMSLVKKARELSFYKGTSHALVRSYIHRALLDILSAIKTGNYSEIYGISGQLSGIYELIIKRGTELNDIKFGDFQATNVFVRMKDQTKEFDAVSNNAVFEFKFNLTLFKLYQQVVVGLKESNMPHLRVLLDERFQEIRNLVYFGENDYGFVAPAIKRYLDTHPNMRKGLKVTKKGFSFKIPLDHLHGFLFSKEMIDSLISEMSERGIIYRGKDIDWNMASRFAEKLIEEKMSQLHGEHFEVIIGVSNAEPKDIEGLHHLSLLGPGSIPEIKSVLEGRKLVKQPSIVIRKNDRLLDGGIDFNSNEMNIEIQNKESEIKFHIDPAMLQQIQNATGFVPVIISIQPMDDLREFLGLNLSQASA